MSVTAVCLHTRHKHMLSPSFTPYSPVPKAKMGTCPITHTHTHRRASAEERGAVICQQGTLAARRCHGNCLLLRTGFASQGPQIGSKASEVPPLLHPTHLRLSPLQTYCQGCLSLALSLPHSPSCLSLSLFCCLSPQRKNSSVLVTSLDFLFARGFISAVCFTSADG